MIAEPARAAARRLCLLAVEAVVSLGLLTVLFARVEVPELWASVRSASPAWLLVALTLYLTSVIASTWRWRVLLMAQDVRVRARVLFSSYLVAGFFNNFLPSIVGGDVVRVKDTARSAESKTLATTVVLVDRVLGLIALALVAAIGSTVATAERGGELSPIWPSWLWMGFIVGAGAAAPALLAPSGVGRLLRPLEIVHPEWVGERIGKLTAALARFRDRPGALAACFVGALTVQGLLVAYYLALAYALDVSVTFWELSAIVPVSFIISMVPVSLNGFGVREAVFSMYFGRLGLPIESALLVSLLGTGLMILFSLSGAFVYLGRRR